MSCMLFVKYVFGVVHWFLKIIWNWISSLILFVMGNLVCVVVLQQVQDPHVIFNIEKQELTRI